MTLDADQLQRLSDRLARDFERWMADHSVEPHYSVETLSSLLEWSPRSLWGEVEAYESSAGRSGLGPVCKFGHRTVRIPASAVKRWLASKTIDAAELASTGAAA